MRGGLRLLVSRSGRHHCPVAHYLRVFTLLFSLKAVDPKLYLEYTQYIYNIYDYYEDYERLRDMLARQRASVEGIKTRINILVLKRRIIRNNIKLAVFISPPHQERRSEQSKTLLSEALGLIGLVFENYEYYLLEHPL
jgi:hypothetical protein